MMIFDTYDAYGTDINDQYFFKYYIHIVENIHQLLPAKAGSLVNACKAD